MTLAALPGPSNADAGGVLSGTVEHLELEGLALEQLSWRLEQDDQGRTQIELSARRGTVAGQALRNIALRCPALRADREQVACRDARIDLESPQLPEPLSSELSFEYRIASGLWSGEAMVTLAGRSFGLNAEGGAETGTRMELVQGALPLTLVAGLVGELPVSVLGGELAAVGTLRFEDDRFSVDLTGRLEGLGFDSPDGSLAGDAIAGDTQLGLVYEYEDESWTLRLGASDLDGEVLLGDLYLSMAQIPGLAVDLGASSAARGAIRLDRFTLRDADSLAAEGQGMVSPEGVVERLELANLELILPQAYERYLGSWLDARGLGPYRSSGRVTGGLSVSGATLDALSLELADVTVEDERARFAVRDANGRLEHGADRVSELNWSSAALYRVPVGAAQLRLRWHPDGLELLEALRLPLLDGALVVDQLALELGEEQLSAVDFQGQVEPLSLAELTRILDWPVMQGSLSGSIPRVRLREGVVEVGGTIGLQVFDGSVELKNLRLERVFGVLPTLAADIELNQIDLEQMTGTFSFGEIQGRLGGYVRDLRLLDWTPVAFDLELGTPPDDDSRHRISQRAVDNLSSIGGGPGAALSQTFLRFFDDFGYKRLGIRCVLNNNVCRMGGVAPTENGYYIVEGSGIPRIDVIGYARQVDWPQLLRRLEAATRAAPSIE